MWVSRYCHATDALELNMNESSTKETSGCASNLLAYEDLGHLRKPVVGIYKPSSIMKIPTSIWKWLNMRLSTMKNMVLLWSKSVEKDSSNCPLFPFFGPFFFFGLSFFLFFFAEALYWFSLSSHGQCSNNNDHHTFIITRYYNSILEQSMTLYECLRRWTGMCNESRVKCMRIYAWWLCHKYDVNYMIMQWQYDNVMRVIWTERWKVAWQYISEWLWKCHDR